MAGEELGDPLAGICEYIGPADKLPVGAWSAIPKYGPEKFAYRWLIGDAEEDSGTRLVRNAELKRDMAIIGVIINQRLVDAVTATYGADWIKIREPNGEMMSLADWKAKFNTDGFALVAIRNKRLELQGTGVVARPYAGHLPENSNAVNLSTIKH